MISILYLRRTAEALNRNRIISEPLNNIILDEINVGYLYQVFKRIALTVKMILILCLLLIA